MSPNKRADNKKMIGVYVDAKLLKRFQEVCSFFGVTMSQIITAYMADKVADYDRTIRGKDAGRVADKSGETDGGDC